MADIKLFVCCHQTKEVPKHPLLVPIQVGSALADSHFPGFIHDDTGDNISIKNRSYCELTAQYWAWKNVEADYYGFFHYRRYLYPNIKVKLPYRVERAISLSLLDELGYKDFEGLIRQYDLIAPKGENMHLSVQEHYTKAKHHHRKDLELVKQIISEQSPKMVEAMEKYLSGPICYFGNIYIMRREVFYNYCTWLFSVLEEFDIRTDTTDYSDHEKRVDGYLAERLFGIYFFFYQGKLKSIELPRVDMRENDYIRRRIINLMLPPNTYFRAMVKKFSAEFVK